MQDSWLAGKVWFRKKTDLKKTRSVKTPLHKYNEVERSYSWPLDIVYFKSNLQLSTSYLAKNFARHYTVRRDTNDPWEDNAGKQSRPDEDRKTVVASINYKKFSHLIITVRILELLDAFLLM